MAFRDHLHDRSVVSDDDLQCDLPLVSDEVPETESLTDRYTRHFLARRRSDYEDPGDDRVLSEFDQVKFNLALFIKSKLNPIYSIGLRPILCQWG